MKNLFPAAALKAVMAFVILHHFRRGLSVPDAVRPAEGSSSGAFFR
jgi:hypothetical protein